MAAHKEKITAAKQRKDANNRDRVAQGDDYFDRLTEDIQSRRDRKKKVDDDASARNFKQAANSMFVTSRMGISQMESPDAKS